MTSLIGFGDTKKLSNRQYGILTAANNGAVIGQKVYTIFDGDYKAMETEFQELISLGLLTQEKGHLENHQSFAITSKGKNALRDRNPRIVIPH